MEFAAIDTPASPVAAAAVGHSSVFGGSRAVKPEHIVFTHRDPRDRATPIEAVDFDVEAAHGRAVNRSASFTEQASDLAQYAVVFSQKRSKRFPGMLITQTNAPQKHEYS